jgi:hypothetical protein
LLPIFSFELFPEAEHSWALYELANDKSSSPEESSSKRSSSKETSDQIRKKDFIDSAIHTYALPVFRFELSKVPKAQHSWTLYEIAYNKSFRRGTPYQVRNIRKDLTDSTGYVYGAYKIIEARLDTMESIKLTLRKLEASWKENPPNKEKYKEVIEEAKAVVTPLRQQLYCLARYIEADRHTPVTLRSEEDGLIIYK